MQLEKRYVLLDTSAYTVLHSYARYSYLRVA